MNIQGASRESEWCLIGEGSADGEKVYWGQIVQTLVSPADLC